MECCWSNSVARATGVARVLRTRATGVARVCDEGKWLCEGPVDEGPVDEGDKSRGQLALRL